MRFTNSALGTDGPDVDADPAQAAFPELRPRTDGEVRFDLAGPLQDCPLPSQLDAPRELVHRGARRAVRQGDVVETNGLTCAFICARFANRGVLQKTHRN